MRPRETESDNRIDPEFAGTPLSGPGPRPVAGPLRAAVVCFTLLGGLACSSPHRASSGSSAAAPVAAAAKPDAPARDQTSAADSSPVSPRSDLDGAIAALRAYYDAIDRRDYAAAFAAWGSSGPPGSPALSDFAAGYASTDSVRLATGTPGRIEGAAGSRFVDIPVTVHAFAGGRETVYAGRYALRRVAVPGASAAERRWHLYRATLAARPASSARH